MEISDESSLDSWLDARFDLEDGEGNPLEKVLTLTSAWTEHSRAVVSKYYSDPLSSPKTQEYFSQ